MRLNYFKIGAVIAFSGIPGVSVASPASAGGWGWDGGHGGWGGDGWGRRHAHGAAAAALGGFAVGAAAGAMFRPGYGPAYGDCYVVERNRRMRSACRIA